MTKKKTPAAPVVPAEPEKKALRQISLYLGGDPKTQPMTFVDDHGIGCGEHVFLEVSVGDKYHHLLYVPTLVHVKVPAEVIAAQFRRGVFAKEYPLRRGMLGEIRDKVKYYRREGMRYSGVFVKDAIAALRAERGADKKDHADADEALHEITLDEQPSLAAEGEKPKKVRGSTDYAGRPTEELLEEAKALGYEEKPAPNGGVRKMRIINFLKNHQNKEAA
jgi:hypothetical protein